MRNSFFFSALLHAVVIAVTYYGVPFLRHPPLVMDTPIAVEVGTIADKTTAPPPEAPKETPKAKEPPPPPEPPKVVETPPPPPMPAPKPEPEPEVAAVPPPPEPKPQAKPAPLPKEEPKPAAPPKLADKKPKHKPKPPDRFASALKDLAKELKKAEPASPAKKEAEKKEAFETQIAKALSSKPRQHDPSLPVSISEIDMVRKQIEKCWNLTSGAKNAEDLIIEIKVEMNADGTVRSADIVDKGRMQRDSFFSAAAEGALRAVLNPNCQPFKLSPEKYDQWKTMTLNFNPKEML